MNRLSERFAKTEEAAETIKPVCGGVPPSHGHAALDRRGCVRGLVRPMGACSRVGSTAAPWRLFGLWGWFDGGFLAAREGDMCIVFKLPGVAADMHAQ